MLWAYFDETVVNVAESASGRLRPKEMLVGGCVAKAEQWERFVPEWRAALAEEGVTEFHAKNFYSFQGEFKWFDKDNDRDLVRHDRFNDKLADIILGSVDNLVAFTSMVAIKDKGTRKAYEDAAIRALYEATKDRDVGRNSLYIILARHPELSPWSILQEI